MTDKLISFWCNHICNKYTVYAIIILIITIFLYTIKHDIYLCIKWLFLDILKVLITNLINHQQFLSQLSNFIFSGSGLIAVIYFFKSHKSDEKK